MRKMLIHYLPADFIDLCVGLDVSRTGKNY
jgi:hypothetical protein